MDQRAWVLDFRQLGGRKAITMKKRQRIHELEVVQPCGVPWDAMEGDDQSRSCDICGKRVYNFSAMDEEEIVNCIRNSGEGVCAQIRRSRDGKIVTKHKAPNRRMFQFSLFSLLALMTAVATLLGFSSHIRFAEKADVDDWGVVEGGAVDVPDDFFMDE